MLAAAGETVSTDDAVADQSGGGSNPYTPDIEDRSSCGSENMTPCVQQPYCNDRLLPSEEGLCLPCGHVVGELPCPSMPYCDGRLIAYLGDVALDTCEECGSEDQPPCGDRARDQPCDEGLYRTTVSAEGGIRLRAEGQDAYCSATPVTGQCGFIGQPTCSGDAALCRGASTVSEDGLMCEECGAQGQGTCDGANQTPCETGLQIVEDAGLAPVCVCPEESTECTREEESVVIAQSGGGPMPGSDGAPGAYGEVSAPDCGQRGTTACQVEPYCGSRLIPDENNKCAQPLQDCGSPIWPCHTCFLLR